MTGFFAAGQAKAEEFLRRGVEVWVVEGRISAAEAEPLISSLNSKTVALGLAHLGAHFAISLPLRFPFGAAARFLYTFFLRLKAELGGLLRRSAREARSLHTVPVMLFALLPGFGRLAYFLSPALAGEKLLLLIPLDQVSRKLPLRLYSRLHLGTLFLYWAQAKQAPAALRRFHPARLIGALGATMRRLSPEAPAIAAVILLDTAVFAVGTYIYLDSGRTVTWWFEERSVIATLDVIQLLIGGVAGVAAYRAFWRHHPRTESGPVSAEAFGIFLWGIGGAGLLFFALEDYFTVHETLGGQLSGFLGIVPVATNTVDDVFILVYALLAATMLYVFHTEIAAERASTSLLIAGAAAAVVMVLTDAFAHSLALKALELPAQTLANTLLMFAFVVRYKEVKALETAERLNLNQVETVR